MKRIYPNDVPAGIDVFCDLDNTIAGGGWTVIFLAQPDYATAPTAYDVMSTSLMSDSQDVLVGYRNSAYALQSGWIKFRLPPNWKAAAPFTYTKPSSSSDSELISDVVIDGTSTTTPTYVRYGSAGFGGGSGNCTGFSFNTASTEGLVCFASSPSDPPVPMYGEWNDARPDVCQTSNQIYDLNAMCSTNRRFSIAIR